MDSVNPLSFAFIFINLSKVANFHSSMKTAYRFKVPSAALAVHCPEFTGIFATIDQILIRVLYTMILPITSKRKDMGDPGTSFISTKLASMIGGLFGGAAILTFIKPQSIGEAFMRGGVSVGSATLLSTPVLRILDLPIDWDYQALAGFLCGFIAYSVLGMIANFLIQHKDSTIVEVAHELKGKKNVKRSNTTRR